MSLNQKISDTEEQYDQALQPGNQYRPIEKEGIILADAGECQNNGRTIKDYNNKYFWQRPSCNFSEVSIGLENVEGRLMALGFLNNDPKPQRIDLVSVNDEMNSFRVHMYNDSNQKYDHSEPFKIDGDDAYVSSIQIAKDQTIRRGLIITYWKQKPVTGKENTFIKVFQQKERMQFANDLPSKPEIDGLELLGNIQPFWLDINADMM